MGVYLLVFLIGAVAIYNLKRDRSPRHIFVLLAFYCVLIPAVFIVSILPMTVLDFSSAHPNHVPELMSLMFVLSVGLVMISKKWPRFAVVLGVLVVLFRCSFSYAYGNVLRNNRMYTDYVAQNIVRDIEDLDDDNIDEMVIRGRLPYSPAANSLFEMMPILKEMVPPGLDPDGMLNGALINHYFSQMFNIADFDDEAARFLKNPGSQFAANPVYDLYLDNNRVYVVFR